MFRLEVHNFQGYFDKVIHISPLRSDEIVPLISGMSSLQVLS